MGHRLRDGRIKPVPLTQAFLGELGHGMDKLDEGRAEFSESISRSRGRYENAISTNRSTWVGGGSPGLIPSRF